MLIIKTGSIHENRVRIESDHVKLKLNNSTENGK